MAKPATPPKHCAYCGKPAHKRTEWVWNPHYSGTEESRARAADAGTTLATWDYAGNGVVVQRVRHEPGKYGSNKESFISRLTIWDGETWELSYDPFCTMNCARWFANAAYRAGYRMPPKTPTS